MQQPRPLDRQHLRRRLARRMRNEGVEALVDCTLLNKTIRQMTLGDNRTTDRMLKTSVQDLQRMLAARRTNANSGSLPASPRSPTSAAQQLEKQEQAAAAPSAPVTSLSAEHRFVPRPKRTGSLGGSKPGAEGGG
jgi:hypothetical protein